MKKSLLTIIFTLACLMGWAQAVVVDIASPEFSFEGDNLVMTTETANASIFYGIVELPSLTDEVVTATTNSLTQVNTYYDQPVEVKGNVVIKAIAVSDQGGTTVQSDTTTLVYGYTLWVELQTAMNRGNTVYAKANGNPAVDTQLLDDLHWAIEEGEMMMGARGSAPYFEAQHFAETINDLCDQIEAIIGTDEPYAVLSADGLTVTFYYDDQKTARGGMDVGPFASPGERGWYDDLNITNVVFDDSFANYTDLTSTAYWFYGLKDLTSITGISNLNTANVTDMTWMFRGCSGLLSLDLRSFNTANVTDTEYIFADCSSLAAIQAGNANIPAEQYAQIGNPNLLVYVNDASLAPQGIQNVVVNGTAQEIILKDAEGNNNWYCPQPFTAQKISYTRNFQQQTKIGVSRGWETIALPFDVQTVAAEDSRIITPFGDTSSPYHFWLRRLTYNGLQSVTQIEANTAYLISMPNSSEYPADYNLSGKVTFSAENASIPETNIVIGESADFVMTPSFERVEAQHHIYALNVGEERAGHPEGSVFEQNYREVRPFEAFTKHLNENGSRFMSIEDMLDGGVTGIEGLKNGKIEEWQNGKDDVYYDLQGRRVLNPTKGIYVKNGQMIIMK